MKEKRPSPVMRLLQWAGPERKWLILSVLCAFGSGILVITSYIGIYRLMDAVLSGVPQGSLWGTVSSTVYGNGASCQSVSWSLGRAEHRRGQDRSQ